MNCAIFGTYPQHRQRRMRTTPAMRSLVRETELNPAHLVLPMFVKHGDKVRAPVASMPGVFQLSKDELVREAQAAFNDGVPAVLLFGIPEKKDEVATEAYADNGITQQAVRLLKKEVPELLVITDICLCEYMSHGHCGLIDKSGNTPVILNDPTLRLLSKTAISHAAAGADILAPSDMMDGRIGAIRSALDDSGFAETPIMSYAAKFASSFYGPFRDAAHSAPEFGDRKTYQMDPANAREAVREVGMDINEGADIVMVKPALAYLDIIHKVKDTFGYPTAAYSVSGEYSMIKAAAQNGWIDERTVTLEALNSIKRAGADIIITYSARDAANWIKADR